MQLGISGNFNTMPLQPILFYTLSPGVSVAYNAVISAD